MVVCHCRVVTDRTIRAALAAGASRVDDITSSSGAGGACGGCVPLIEQLIADAALALQQPTLLERHQAERRNLGRTTWLPASA